MQYPTEQMRNFILAKGYPGTKAMLDELLRRAAPATVPRDPSCGLPGCLHRPTAGRPACCGSTVGHYPGCPTRADSPAAPAEPEDCVEYRSEYGRDECETEWCARCYPDHRCDAEYCPRCAPAITTEETS